MLSRVVRSETWSWSLGLEVLAFETWPWSATAARPVALEGVGEHVRVEVITQPEFGGEVAESFRKRKETFSCRVCSRRVNSLKV
jgi:hypothetical protein